MGPEVLAAMAVVSTVASVAGQFIKQGQTSGISTYNAGAAENEAGVVRAAGQSDASEIRRRGSRTQSSLRAATGAAGLIANEGSPYEVLLANAEEIELEAQRRIFRGENDARRLLSQSRLDRYRAEADSPSYLQAGAGLIEGGVKAYRILSTPTPTTIPPGGFFGGPTAPRPD